MKTVYIKVQPVDVSPTNITSEWIGKTLAEYCEANGVMGVTFTDPWYRTIFMNADRWGDYEIGSRKLLSTKIDGIEVWLKCPF